MDFFRIVSRVPALAYLAWLVSLCDMQATSVYFKVFTHIVILKKTISAQSIFIKPAEYLLVCLVAVRDIWKLQYVYY